MITFMASLFIKDSKIIRTIGKAGIRSIKRGSRNRTEYFAVLWKMACRYDQWFDCNYCRRIQQPFRCRIVDHHVDRLSASGQEPDPEHPFGHGRMEYISGLLVSVAILVMGFELIGSSIGKLRSPEPIESSALVFGILIASILVKLYMFFTIIP